MSTRLVCVLTLFSACATPADDETADRRRRPDAAVPVGVDAAAPSLAVAGSVSCYRTNDPGASCTAPEVCCFDNFTSEHNGSCSTSTCGWGTITCDGPEDCGGGQHCCSHPIEDPEWGRVGYRLACQAAACGAPPTDYELCHPGGPACSNGRACVTANGNANDLPQSLYVCK